MKKTFAALIALLAVVIAAMPALAETQHERHIRLATELLKEMEKQSDADAFADSIRTSKAVAIFPAVVSAGLGIGGMSGGGVVLMRDEKGGWSGPSFVSLAGASIGLQIGVSKTGLVLCAINDEGRRVFTGGTGFTLGGDVSVAAGPTGRSAKAATDTRAAASIYSYSISEGAFVGITFSGSNISINADANKAYWGKSLEASEALSRKAKSAKIDPLVAQLNKLTKMAK